MVVCIKRHAASILKALQHNFDCDVETPPPDLDTASNSVLLLFSSSVPRPRVILDCVRKDIDDELGNVVPVHRLVRSRNFETFDPGDIVGVGGWWGPSERFALLFRIIPLHLGGEPGDVDGPRANGAADSAAACLERPIAISDNARHAVGCAVSDLKCIASERRATHLTRSSIDHTQTSKARRLPLPYLHPGRQHHDISILEADSTLEPSYAPHGGGRTLAGLYL